MLASAYITNKLAAANSNAIPYRATLIWLIGLRIIASKKNYSSCQGISIFQDTIKNVFSSTKYSVHDLLIGNGLKELLFIIQLAFKGKIIHITPSWVSYKEHIRILNKENDLIEIETTIEDDYKIKPDHLENILKQYPNDKWQIIK